MKWGDMEDIELARSLLQQEQLNLVIVKEGQVFLKSMEEGLHSFFQAIVSLGNDLHGAAIADRIVGSTVAMLCLYAQIASVYADIASTGALAMLREKGVSVSSKNEVPHILNYDGTDLCPFEKLALSASSPSQLFSSLESFFAEGNQ
jgi:hypothetical protein